MSRNPRARSVLYLPLFTVLCLNSRLTARIFLYEHIFSGHLACPSLRWRHLHIAMSCMQLRVWLFMHSCPAFWGRATGISDSPSSRLRMQAHDPDRCLEYAHARSHTWTLTLHRGLSFTNADVMITVPTISAPKSPTRGRVGQHRESAPLRYCD